MTQAVPCQPSLVCECTSLPSTLTGLCCFSASRTVRAFSKGGIFSLQWGGGSRGKQWGMRAPSLPLYPWPAC